MTLTRSQAAFIVVVSVLVGGALNIIAALCQRYFFTELLPDTTAFRWIMTLWLAIGFTAVGCGIAGIYFALRRGTFNTGLLTVFCVLYCFEFTVDGVQLRWAEIAASVGWAIRSLGFAARFNFVGLGLLIWLMILRGRTGPRSAALPTAPSAHAV